MPLETSSGCPWTWRPRRVYVDGNPRRQRTWSQPVSPCAGRARLGACLPLPFSPPAGSEKTRRWDFGGHVFQWFWALLLGARHGIDVTAERVVVEGGGSLTYLYLWLQGHSCLVEVKVTGRSNSREVLWVALEVHVTDTPKVVSKRLKNQINFPEQKTYTRSFFSEMSADPPISRLFQRSRRP